MEKSKIKNLKIRLKAGVLTAVALIPGVSCGRNVGKQEPGANVSIETEANTEKNTSNIITTTTTKGNKTTTNTFVTEPTNNNGYVDYNNNNNNYVDNTTNSNTNSTEAKTENKTNPTTHQNTTQKTTTVKIKNSDIKVTTTKAHTQKPTTQKPVQTTAKPTTQKPVETTTVKVTEPPVTTVPYDKRSYTKYDLTSGDPAAARCAMDQLSTQFGREMFNGYCGPRSLSGEDEALAIIIALNYNQGLNNEMIGHYYTYDTMDEFKGACDILDLAKYQYDYNSQVDFSKYVMDDNLAFFINNISSEYKEYMNGNTEPLINDMNSYFENNSEYVDDYVKYYFMCNTKKSTINECDELDYARELYFDNVLAPLFNQFESNRHYVKIR